MVWKEKVAGLKAKMIICTPIEVDALSTNTDILTFLTVHTRSSPSVWHTEVFRLVEVMAAG